MTDAGRAPIDVAAAASALESSHPLDILRWVSARVAKLTFATGFGPEGCVIIDLIARAGLPIDLFTLDTGVLFPETYELWKQLEATYGITIRRVEPSQAIPEQALVHGPALWERDADRCCDLRKVIPLRHELAKFDAWITAIRREQTRERANARVVEHDAKFGLVKVNPLARWTHDDVWAHLYAHDVPYNVLHDRGYPSIGCAPCTSQVAAGEDPRSGRWKGSAKKECGLHVLDDKGSTDAA
ncbi:MAG TPA: phosphoadenylyl-sulfate reductase [Kofleriaceae bacterium]|nr:phosphoadenylyl-sulfate reductase [Kofleriaceae bacterium]